MDDLTTFEQALDNRIQRLVSPAGQAFDAAAITRSAVATRRGSRMRRIGLDLPDRSLFPARSVMPAVAIVLLLAALAAAGLALVANRATPPDAILYADGARLHVLDPRTGDDQVLPALAVGGDTFAAPAWAPDHRHLSWTADTQLDYGLWIADGDGRNAHAVAGIGGEYAWSPDGTRIAGMTLGDVAPRLGIVNADGTGLHQLEVNFWKDSGGPTWSPDGSDVVLTDRDTHGMVIVDVASDTARTSPGGCCQYEPVWSPDGSLIAYSTGADAGAALDVIRADGGGYRTIASGGGYMLAWSPDSRSLAFATLGDGGSGYKISIVDVASGQRRDVELSTLAQQVRWAPDGASLSYLTNDGKLWTVNADGTQARLLATGVRGFDR